MPHYADGTLGEAGDRVKGTTYNQKEIVEGTIAQITSQGTACNCVVQFDDITGEDPKMRYPRGRAGVDWDYTAVSDLELIETLPTTDELFEKVADLGIAVFPEPEA